MSLNKKDESLPDDYYEPRPFNPKAWWGSIAVICALIISSSVFITRSYLKRNRYEAANYRPSLMYKLETNLRATNRDGTEVSFNDDLFKKKVFVAGYQYTDCPSGCLGMASVMSRLHEEFAEEYPHFQLVSISVNPKGDTPEKMNAWVKKQGVDVPNWWFLTGDEKVIKEYMRDEFKLLETQVNTDPDTIASVGPYMHDQRLVLVDEFANVRGFYDVMHQELGALNFERLKKDVEILLKNFDPDDPTDRDNNEK